MVKEIYSQRQEKKALYCCCCNAESEFSSRIGVLTCWNLGIMRLLTVSLKLSTSAAGNAVSPPASGWFKKYKTVIYLEIQRKYNRISRFHSMHWKDSNRLI